MRLDRLGLTRYGHFTDFNVDFSLPDAESLDLHIVHGNNEAGKSTLFSALLDALYGIPLRTDYAFKHEGKALRIDATLINQASVLTIGRQKSALLDDAGNTIPQSALEALLGGVSRENYQQMFSMNDKTLEQGGDDILASKGELGSLLFSASTGLTGIHRRLDDLLATDSDFYAPGKRKTGLKESVDELKALADRRKAVDVQVGQHRDMQRHADDARVAYERAAAAHEEHRRTLRGMQKRQQALAALQQRRREQDKLDALPDLPEVPEDWWQSAAPFLQQAAVAQTQLDDLQQRTAELQAEVDTYVADKTAIDAEPTIDELTRQAERIDTWQEELEREDIAPEQLDADIAMLCRQLGLPMASTVKGTQVSGERRQQLRALLAEYDGLQVRLREARRESGDALTALSDLPEPITAQASDPSALRDWLTVFASNRQGASVAELAQKCRQQQSKIDGLLLELQPWQGSPDTLLSLTIPSLAALEKRRDDAMQMQTKLDTERTMLEQCQKSVTEKKTSLQELIGAAPWADEGVLQAQQDQRHQCWAEHVTLIDSAADTPLLKDSAERFDSALRQENETRQQRESHSHEIARHQEMRKGHAAAEHQLNAQSTVCEALATTLDALKTEHADAASAVGLPVVIGFDELLAWRRQHDLIRHESLALKAQEHELSAEHESRDALLQRLNTLLQQLAIERSPAECQRLGFPEDDRAATLEERVQAAHRVVANIETEVEASRELHRKRTAAKQALNKRENNVEQLSRSLADWNDRWQQSITGTCLSDVKPELASERLTDLENLDPLLEKRERHRQRLANLEVESQEFGTQIDTLSSALSLLASDPPVLRIKAVRERLGAALLAQSRQNDKLEALSASRDKLALRKHDLQPILEALAQRYRLLSVNTVPELQIKLDTVKQREESLSSKHQAEQTLVEILGSASVEDAVASMQETDADALTIDLDAALLEEATVNDARAETLAALKGAERDLASLGHDNAAARLEEEIVSLQLQIEDRARQCLRLRLGVAALREGMRHYQQSHRSAMLDSASTAFRALTRGHYTRLVVQPERQRQELLYALGADGTTLVASNLSTGTRFQLYLALRIAGYREYATHATPPPFVADDIFESFDDGRTLQSLQQFVEMAQVGQLIYLTHHERVVELALEASHGRAQIHRLPDAPRARAVVS